MTPAVQHLKRVGELCYELIAAVFNAVYKLVTRTALYALTAFLVLHFTTNSEMFKSWLMDTLSDELPGQFNCTSIQFGPMPWRVTLLDTDIRDPRGEPIIQVKRTRAAVDLLAMGVWALKKAVRGDSQVFELRFSEAHVRGADVLVDVKSNGELGIRDAFTDPSEEDDGKPGARVEINGIVVEGNSRVRVIVENSGIDIIGEELDIVDTKVTIVDGAVRVDSNRLRSGKGRYQMKGLGPPGKEAMDLPWKNLDAIDALWNDGILDIDEAELQVSNAPTIFRGVINTRGEFTEFNFGVQSEIPEEDPAVKQYLGNTIQTSGLVDLHMGGDTNYGVILNASIRSPEIVARGISMGPSTLGIHIAPEECYRRTPGLRIEISPFSVGAMGGVVHIDKFALWPNGYDNENTYMEFETSLSNINPAEAWDSGFVPSSVALPVILDGNASLSAKAGMELGPDYFSIDANIDGMMDWNGDTHWPLSTQYGASGAAVIQYSNNQLRVDSSGLNLWSGKDSANVLGNINLTTGDLNATVDLKAAIGPYLKVAGVPNITGQVELQNTSVSGSLQSPDLDGKLMISGARVPGYRIRSAETEVTLKDGLLSINRLNLKSRHGNLQADTNIKLWNENIKALDPQMPLRAKRITVTGYDLKQLNLESMSGLLNAKSPSIALNLRGNELNLRGKAVMNARNLTLGKERFKSAKATIDTDGKSYKISQLAAKSARGTAITGSGKWSPKRRHLKANLTAKNVNLADVGTILGTRLPISGKIKELNLNADGKLRRLAMWGALKVKNFGYQSIRLGNANLTIERPKKGKMEIKSSAFFRGTKLKNASLSLNKRGIPHKLFAQITLSKLNILKAVPALRKKFKSMKVNSGSADVSLDFSGTGTTRISLTAPDGGVRIKPTGLPALKNKGDLWGALVGDVINVERLELDWSGQRVGLCGHINLNGPVNLDVAGAVALHELNLRDYVNDAQGYLVTNSKTQTDNPFSNSCLALVVDPKAAKRLNGAMGYITIRNTLTAPAINGSLVMKDVAMTLKGVNRELAIKTGTITLANNKGAPTISISPEERLIGTFGDGAIEIEGFARLPRLEKRVSANDWTPDEVIVKLKGTSISWASPKEYQLTFHPDLELNLKHLRKQPDGPQPNLALTGKIEVTDGSYYKSFDRFARALGNVGGRTVERYQRDVRELMPALKNLRLGLDVSGVNFQVDSGFGVGTANLETRFNVRVGGTLEKIDVRGPLEVTEGMITYEFTNKEFEVERGTLDFDGDPAHPLVDIEAAADYVVQNVAKSTFQQSTDDEDDVRVTITLKGRLPDVAVTLSSNKPTLTQTDLQYLIVTGKTKAGFSEQGGEFSYGANLTQLVTRLIKAPFIEEFSYRPGSDGGELEIISRFAGFKFRVTAKQTGEGNSYNVGFSYKITDQLRLEGSLRDREEDRPQKYTAKFKYSIPLD